MLSIWFLFYDWAKSAIELLVRDATVRSHSPMRSVESNSIVRSSLYVAAVRTIGQPVLTVASGSFIRTTEYRP